MATNNIDQFISLSGDVIRWLLTWSWQLCLLLGVAWAVLKLDRSGSPVIRYRIWLIALLAALALPLLTTISHRLNLPGAIAPFPLENIGDASKFAEVPFQNSKWRTTRHRVDINYLKEHNIKKCSLVKKKWKEAETEAPTY